MNEQDRTTIINGIVSQIRTAGDYYAQREKLRSFSLVLSPEVYRRVEQALSARGRA